MKNKILLVLIFVWFLIPYSILWKFIFENWFDIYKFFEQTSYSKISIFWSSDVILTWISLITFTLLSSLKNKNKAFIIIWTLCIWPSFSLPLFLYLTEKEKS